MPPSLFNTLPPVPVDPASTLRAPSLSKSPGEGMDIIMPKPDAAPVIASPPGAASTAPPAKDLDRDALLGRLRERGARLSATQIASLLKLVE